MKRSTVIVIIVSCLLAGLSVNLFAGTEQNVNKKFSDIKSIKCKFALGDVIIKQSPDKQVHVSLVYTYNKNYFNPVMTVIGNSLVLKEEFPDNGDNNNGSSQWTISLPKETKIKINTGTGDITVTDAELEIDANTGTGAIDISDAKGEFEMNTGTGDVNLKNSDGEFDLNTGTGDVHITDTKGEFKANSGIGGVDAVNVTIVFEGTFNSGTGDVDVVDPKGDEFEITISSGTGDAVLDFDGQPLNGYFRMKCNARRGKIVAPFKFDTENYYDSGGRQKTLEKSYTKGDEKRRFIISTGTGKAVVKK